MRLLYEGEYMNCTQFKNLLFDNGIDSYLINQMMSVIKPSILTPGGLYPAKLFVDEIDFQKSLEILKNYTKNNSNN